MVHDLWEAQAIAKRVRQWPLAALTLVQVLRSTATLPAEQALDLESLAYGVLQQGAEFASWQRTYQAPRPSSNESEEPILLTRQGDVVQATLNRPRSRNALSCEMRDAWVAALSLLDADPAIRVLKVAATGKCFSVGGELAEFGSAPDPATAHWVRTVHSPARLALRHASKLRFEIHGACLGSGIELAAFGQYLIADPTAFFQLPELNLGLLPGAGGTVSIPRRIGRQKTAWLALSGRRIRARTALAWGLVDEVRPLSERTVSDPTRVDTNLSPTSSTNSSNKFTTESEECFDDADV